MCVRERRKKKKLCQCQSAQTPSMSLAVLSDSASDSSESANCGGDSGGGGGCDSELLCQPVSAGDCSRPENACNFLKTRVLVGVFGNKRGFLLSPLRIL